MAAARYFSVTVVGAVAFFAIFGPPRFRWLGKSKRSRPYLIRGLADYDVLLANRAFFALPSQNGAPGPGIRNCLDYGRAGLYALVSARISIRFRNPRE